MIHRRQFLTTASQTSFWLGGSLITASSATASLLAQVAKGATPRKGRLFSPQFQMYLGKRIGSMGMIDLATMKYSFIDTAGVLGHSVSFHPNKKIAYMFGQRPGTQSAVVDIEQAKLLKVIDADQNRHFYGHGSFHPDGKLVYCSENAMDTGEGLITIRNTETWEVEGELKTYGYGPHEILYIPQRDQFVVANGGKLPETRESNPFKWQPIDSTLIYIDAKTGKIVERATLPQGHATFSMRHLIVDPKGEFVVLGIRDYTVRETQAGCIAIHRPVTKMEKVQIMGYPDQSQKDLLGPHTLSVAVDRKHMTAAYAHPDPERISLWDNKDPSNPRLMVSHSVPRPQGIAKLPHHDLYIATSYAGIFTAMSSKTGEIKDLPWSAEIRGLNWRHATVLI